MPTPLNGTYFLYNTGAGKYLDVQASRVGDGSSIIAFTLNDPPSENQKWKFVRQSSDGLTCTLQSAHANGFIYAISLVQGTLLVQSQIPVVWQLDPCGENAYRIRLLSARIPLVLAFPLETIQGGPAVLEIEDATNDNQVWNFQVV